MTHTVYHGDCLDVLRSMPDNSVDAVVTDPPYGLSNTTPDKVTDAIVRWAAGDREYITAGRGFMSQSWDAFVPPPAVWDECFRVLKPGGHLVAFAGSRTQDLMGLSIRLAGLEIRENLAYLYGSGFPKSLDVSKAIDKLNSKPLDRLRDFGAYVKAARIEAGLTQADVNRAMDMPQGCGWWEGKGAGAKWDLHLPSLDTWAKLKTVVTTLGDDFDYLIEWAEAEREVIRMRTGAQSESTGRYGAWGNDDGTGRSEFAETSAATEAAKRWQGWGTALKPAHEPIILARKPLGGSTVASNTLTWGTGGLNIDATRIGAKADPPFMYAAKAPKRERPSYTTEDGQTVQHATVKPLSIMQWLVKLVTPEGCTVLDPFAGSGTTIEAAILEGFNVIGIEREEAYLPLIQQRIDRATDVLPMAS